MHQSLDPQRTTWHITFGTYGTRLHGDDQPTVDLNHNQRGEAFIKSNPQRIRREQDRMKFASVYLTLK